MSALVAKLSGEHGAGAVCSALGLPRSSYYQSLAGGPSRRSAEDGDLKREISRVYAENKRVYGSPRIQLALRAESRRHSKRRISRLMAELGIRGRSRARRRPRLTDSRHSDRIAPNLLGQLDGIERPNQVWVSDTTCLRAREGWLYLAATMDYYSRKIVGWEVSSANDGELTCRALRKALGAHPGSRPLHHSDRGGTYTCKAFADTLSLGGGTASMSRKGDCYDNAAMESFFGTLKAEWVGDRRYSTVGECRSDIFEYVEGFYNSRRIHTSIGMAPSRKMAEGNGEPSRKALRPAASPPCGKVALDNQT